MLFRETFDPHRFVSDAELDEFRRFMARLLALKRSKFEAAMRAIRRIGGVTQRAIDDPTIAYVDILVGKSDGRRPASQRRERDRFRLLNVGSRAPDPRRRRAVPAPK